MTDSTNDTGPEAPTAHKDLRSEIEKLDASRLVSDLIGKRDSGAQLLRVLDLNVSADDVAMQDGDQLWELCGQYLHCIDRSHEALKLFLKLYDKKLEAQSKAGRLHKGMPLIWISQCFASLGFAVHAKRYAMLALCEDAVTGSGAVSPDGGAYYQLVWRSGLGEAELNAFAKQTFQRYQQSPELGLYPEALLQLLQNTWVTEMPTPAEAFHYVVSAPYVRSLMNRTLTDDRALEDLAEYLISCMAGCRCARLKQTPSTDYDLVCSIEGVHLDFRAEWGRYFVCECKNSKHGSDFSDFAKFCRVLDSVKARFGILFSPEGFSDAAKREQLKIYQDRGMVLIVLDKNDLQNVSKGHNLITLLRERYEMTRLDLS